MKETEITVQVFNPIEEIKLKLNSLGFEIIEKYSMTDYYFSKYSIEELKNFNYADLIKNSFLVRDIKDDKPKILLTYKNKDIDDLGNVISEEKIKCRLGILQNALDIFNSIGLNNWSILNQKIIIYKKDSVCFALQEVVNLGIFIEYEEDETMSNLSTQEKISLMKTTLKKLNLNLGEDFSCKKVYMKFKKRNN